MRIIDVLYINVSYCVGYLEVEGEVEEVQREQTQHVHVERGGIHVMLPQLRRVCLQHSILQIC